MRRSAPRTIAAVHARVHPSQIPRVFGQYLDQVYAQRNALKLDGQNVFIYRKATDNSDELDVAFGVGAAGPFEPIGAVQPTEVPRGDVATTVHRGPYARLGAAHDAVIAWCRANGHRLAGPRWEVYGHWTEDEAQLRTDVYYLLQSDVPGAR